MDQIKTEQLLQVINNISEDFLNKINDLIADDTEINLEDKISLWTYSATCISTKSLEHLIKSKLVTKDDAKEFVKFFSRNLTNHINEMKKSKKGM